MLRRIGEALWHYYYYDGFYESELESPQGVLRSSSFYSFILTFFSLLVGNFSRYKCLNLLNFFYRMS
jgi:hypothetical protein